MRRMGGGAPNIGCFEKGESMLGPQVKTGQASGCKRRLPERTRYWSALNTRLLGRSFARTDFVRAARESR
jgi:hypothetical protein